MSEAADRNRRRRSWTLLACSVVLAAVGAIGLAYLLWSYVPQHVRHFAEVGVSLPLATRVAITASNWFVRLFPILVVLGMAAMAAVVGVLVVLSQTTPSHRVVTAVAAGVFLVAAAEILSCGLIVYAIHAAY